MSYSWKHYISFAIELSGRTDEPALRSAISRAYYGAFCYSRNYLTNTSKIRTPKEDLGKIHASVIDYLLESDDDDEKLAGQHLSNLRRQRNRADYETNYIVQSENIIKLIGNANKVVEIIDSFQ